MKRASRHRSDTQILEFSDFSGGVNIRTAPENIALNELADCVNMTYSTAPGRLRTRQGTGEPIHDFGSPISGMYWYDGGLVVAAGGSLYYHTTSETRLLGTLTGSLAPSWAEFGGDLYVASGGKIQLFAHATHVLTAVEDSPAAAIGVYARAGRLFCWQSDSDALRGSAVGDASRWTIPPSATDADPVETQIGYKVAGNIVCCIPSLTDVIVFKTHAAFRLVGEYPQWTIKEISRDEVLSNGHSAVNIGGYLFYIESSKGVRLLQGTQGYEEIMPADALQKVNPWIRDHLDASKCRLWHLQARNILLVAPGAETILPAYYEFGLSSMPVLKWEFPTPVTDVVEPDHDSLFLAMGNCIYDFSGASSSDYDPATATLSFVHCRFSSKRLVGFSEYLLKRIGVTTNMLRRVISQDTLTINCSGRRLLPIVFYSDESAPVYGNITPVYGNDTPIGNVYKEKQDFTKHNMFRTRALQIQFESTGAPFELSRFAIEYVPVGVVA